MARPHERNYGFHHNQRFLTMKEQTIYFQDHRGVIRSMSSEQYEELRAKEQSDKDSRNGVSPPRGEVISEAPPRPVRGVEETKNPQPTR